MEGTTIIDLKVLVTVGTLLLSVAGFAFSKADDANERTDELKTLIQNNTNSIAQLRYDISREYATKEDVRETVNDLKDTIADLKNTITSQFDKLEKKLDEK